MKLITDIKRGRISPMGLSYMDGGINIAIAVSEAETGEFGIAIYQGNQEIERIAFPDECRIGNMYAVHMSGKWKKELSYLFYAGDKLIADPYARLVTGRQTWGDEKRGEETVRALIPFEEADEAWEKDKPLQIPFDETILYSLHMRGFTKHTSSHVSKKGTFQGLCEKIPYLKELGITSVLTMPIYEFDEIIKNPAYQEIDPSLSPYFEEGKDIWKYRLNYWGFAEEGNYYFAPKASYAAGKSPDKELKDLILKLHDNGIEILMQMYFSPKLSPDFIRDVLRFWVLEYHVDGFQLMGAKIPMELLGKDALLGRTKLIAEHTMAEAIYERNAKAKRFCNLASYQDGFRADARRFLKGDSDMVYAMSEHLKRASEMEGIVNHLTDYRGFTLLDLVSYDRKHNEENGENNRDGSDYNYSWNCGAEGVSRKKSINQLRLSQRKNALTMLFMAQGTPLLLAGDECGHTTLGNNNAYCHDNKLNYINWSRNQSEEELYQFVRKLIQLRKEHKILHLGKRLRMTDTLSCGFPDLSYHGQQAWQTQFENYNHHLAAMYCGFYENPSLMNSGIAPAGSMQGDFIYIAYNMHWTPQDFAIPALPKGYEWEITLQSKADASLKERQDGERKTGKDMCLSLSARSTAILLGHKKGNEKVSEVKDEKGINL